MVRALQPSVANFAVTFKGPAATVRLGPHAAEEYRAIQSGNDKNSVQRRTHIQRYFTAFCTEANYRRICQKKSSRKREISRTGMAGLWRFLLSRRGNGDFMEP